MRKSLLKNVSVAAYVRASVPICSRWRMPSTVKTEPVPESMHEETTEAAESCPTQAIVVTD
ncbi:ferredoxin [Pontiellaceae bacterium B1224]|nr:ferredoxin [Pontiellaceae bacterium B1224]